MKKVTENDFLKELGPYGKYAELGQRLVNETGLDVDSFSRLVFAAEREENTSNGSKEAFAFYLEGNVDVSKLKKTIANWNTTLKVEKYHGVEVYTDGSGWELGKAVRGHR